MILAEQSLRTLVYNILLEGLRDDIVKLKDRLKTEPASPVDPHEWHWLMAHGMLGGRRAEGKPTEIDPDEEIIDKLPRKWQVWLVDNFVKKNSAGDKLRDALKHVKTYSDKEDSYTKAYKYNTHNKFIDAKFRDVVDEAVPLNSPMKNAAGEIMKDRDGKDIMVPRHWQNPGDITKMKLIDLKLIKRLYAEWWSTVNVDTTDTSCKLPVEKGGNKIGTFGPWEVYLPTTSQNSIMIPGVDPVTHDPWTVWCTTHINRRNDFLSYVRTGTMIFYVINTEYSPKNPESRISLGFVHGELDLSGGMITVNGMNDMLDGNDLKRIFGKYYKSILDCAKEVATEHGGVHPARKELDEARKNPVKFNDMLQGLNEHDAWDLVSSALRHDVLPEIITALAVHPFSLVRSAVAGYDKIDKTTQKKLVIDDDGEVRAALARNKSTPFPLFEKFASDHDAVVRRAVAASWRVKELPVPVLMKLARDTDIEVRRAIANSSNLPNEVLEAAREGLTIPAGFSTYR
jgi:hypothetical protein